MGSLKVVLCTYQAVPAEDTASITMKKAKPQPSCLKGICWPSYDFVGSSDIAQYVYSTGTAHGKRVQAMGGAKNHGVVLPDADLDQTVRDITGAAFG